MRWRRRGDPRSRCASAGKLAGAHRFCVTRHATTGCFLLRARAVQLGFCFLRAPRNTCPSLAASRADYCHHFSSNKPVREPFPDGLAGAALGSGFAVDSALGVASAGFEEGPSMFAVGSLGAGRSLRFRRGVARTGGGAAAVGAAAMGAGGAGAAGAAEAIGIATGGGTATLRII